MAPLSLVPQSKLWDLNIAGSSIHTFSHYKGLAMKTVSDTISRLAHFIMSLEFQQRFRCGLDFQTCPLLSESTNVISR